MEIIAGVTLKDGVVKNLLKKKISLKSFDFIHVFFYNKNIKIPGNFDVRLKP